MATKGGKKAAGSNRVSSATATPREVASVAASAAGLDKRPKITIWPEWNDNDVNAEKWEAAHKGKDDKKGKSPTVQQHFFDDPDGKLDMPSSLRVDHWKRPQDFLTEKTPVVVDMDHMTNDFDLISANEHLHESELLRYVISQVTTLWELCMDRTQVVETPPVDPTEDLLHTWRPWEHIYSLCRVAKHHIPLYNPHGKYIIRLYWMGCWRKILVDDLLPFDENEQLLLPATTLSHELWPMLLTKALIKVASLDYSGGNPGAEFGDITIIHCLTGWLPEAIPLQQGHLGEVWQLMKSMLPEWRLPEPEPEKTMDLTADSSKKEGPNSATAESIKDEKGEGAPGKESKADGKDRGKGKDKEKGGKDSKEDKKDKKDKDKDKDKDKNKEKNMSEEVVVPEKPEVVVFATFGSTAKYPVKVSTLGQMADASENLRQNGLSHIYPHPVCITQTRSCPLEPPPPPEVVPAWKLIRPRKKKEPPTDEPKCAPEPPKEIQCVEISSPFVNYKVSHIPIPTDTSRQRSCLERGATHSRPGTGSVRSISIEETDENIPELEKVKVHPPTQPDVLTLEETTKDAAEEGSQSGQKSKSNVSAKQRMSAKQERSLEGADDTTGQHTEKNAGKTGSAKSERGRSGKRTESRNSKRDDAEDKKDKPKEKDAVKPSPHPADSAQGLAQVGLVQESRMSLAVGAEVGEGGEVDPEQAAMHGVEEGQGDGTRQKKRWMDFDQFSICFKMLYIFHKPHTYLCNQRHSDLRNVSPSGSTAPPKAEKKLAATAPGSPGPEDKTSYFLFVDNLNPTEIVISLSVLPRWFDPPPLVEDKKGGKTGKDKESEKEPTVISSISNMEGSMLGRDHAPVPPPPVTPGNLVAEPYSWKSLVTGQPILRLRTTGTRAAVLSLPAGRHVLRFIMTSPLGYHVHMCSTVNFVFGDEETVMPQLTNESCRFRDNALQVVTSLGKCIAGFTDQEQLSQAMQQLVAFHCPYLKDKALSKQKHFQIFNDALYHMLRKALRDIASPDIALAWRAFNFDVTTPNILALPHGSRPDTRTEELSPTLPTVLSPQMSVKHSALQPEVSKPTGSASARGSAKPGNKKPTEKSGDSKPPSEPEKTENVWATRYMEPTPEEHVAAVKIQKAWRGFWVRKVKQARTPGTEENVKAQEKLMKSWAVIEPCAEENGLVLFREMFRKDIDLMQHFTFYKDEWNKISYADYRGVFPDQSSNTWFVVFREVFYVKEETLAVPRLYVPIPTCMLRVIDNDTGRQLPTVFQKVAPYDYKPNRKGYTFVAEARTIEQPLLSGPWRMRLIGSLSPLPAPRSAEVNSNFQVKEIRDYYLPNPNNIIFRYTVKVTEDQVCSLQVSTSKADVYVRLCVLDNEEEVCSATGKGHVVIPAHIFHKDPLPPGEEQQQQQPPATQTEPKRSSSRTSNRGGTKGVKGKRSESAKSPEGGRASRVSVHSDHGMSEEQDEKDIKPHKYIVQAVVMKNSWPLSESAWIFVQQLKDQEKNELKVAYKERLPSPAKNEKSQPTGQKGKPKGKGDKGSKDKQETKGSRPPSQQFDITKPNWTLRMVVDATSAEDIEVKKDTERVDEIRSMKKAWEDAEPGRAAKALQSRLKYLNTHTIKLQTDIDDKDKEKEGEQTSMTEVPLSGVDQPEVGVSIPSQTPLSAIDPSMAAMEGEREVVLTLEPPPLATPREMLQPLDISPFIRHTLDSPRLLDEAETQRQLEERYRQIAEYKELRQQVESWRAQDRAARNASKIRQLEDAQALQTRRDVLREETNIPREAFRQRYLEAERRRQEELAQQEAALKAEQEAKSDKGRKSAKGKNSGKKKK